MKAYRRGAHTVFEIHLDLVWITKYRRPALSGEVGVGVRDLIREICGQHEVTIMEYIANQNSDQDQDFRVDG